MEVQVVIAFVACLVVHRFGEVGLPLNDSGPHGVPPAQVVTARGTGAMRAKALLERVPPSLHRPLLQLTPSRSANHPEGALVFIAEAAAKPVRARQHSHAVYTGRKRQKLRQPLRGEPARVQLDQRRVQGARDIRVAHEECVLHGCCEAKRMALHEAGETCERERRGKRLC